MADLEKDGVAPEVVPERGELVDAPLVPGPARQLVLTLAPRALSFKNWIH
jgi:hypothetical protein